MRAARGALVAIGAAGLLVGAWLLVTTVRPAGLVGLLVWFAAAVVLHDALLSPLLFAAGWVLRLGSRRIPMAALAVVQIAAIVGGVGSLLLLPAIQAKRLGTRNPTVLPFDYVAHLAGLWVVLAAVTVVALAVVLVLDRRRGRTGVGPIAASPAAR